MLIEESISICQQLLPLTMRFCLNSKERVRTQLCMGPSGSKRTRSKHVDLNLFGCATRRPHQSSHTPSKRVNGRVKLVFPNCFLLPKTKALLSSTTVHPLKEVGMHLKSKKTSSEKRQKQRQRNPIPDGCWRRI